MDGIAAQVPAENPISPDLLALSRYGKVEGHIGQQPIYVEDFCTPAAAYLLFEGRAHTVTHTGRNLDVRSVVHSREWIGLESAFEAPDALEMQQRSIFVFPDSHWVKVPYTNFPDMLEEGALYSRVVEDIRGCAMEQQRKRNALETRGVLQRVVIHLAREIVAYGHEIRSALPESQIEIGEVVGAQRCTVGKRIQQLVAAGIVETLHGKTRSYALTGIRILEPAKLIHMCLDQSLEGDICPQYPGKVEAWLHRK